MSRFVPFVLGGIVGAVAGILLAPSKGEDTRKQIANAVNDTIPSDNATARNLKSKADSFVDQAAKKSTVAINAVIDKSAEVKASLTERAEKSIPDNVASGEAADELREKIDAARERIAAQVAKNAEAIQDAAVDKIPVVVDAAATAGAKVSNAVGSIKEALPKVEIEVGVKKAPSAEDTAPMTAVASTDEAAVPAAATDAPAAATTDAAPAADQASKPE